METFIYKPGTYKGPVVLVPAEGPRTPPTITLPDGRQITGQYLNTNEGRHQFVFPRELYEYEDLQISYGGQTGTIASGAVSYEGNSIGNWQAREKGSLGPGGFATGGGLTVQGGYGPSQIGQYGFAPANVEGLFPDPTFADFDPIKQAPFKYTNPFDFAKKFGEYNRKELRANWDQAKNMGMEALNLELQGLQGFVPAAAALQRQEVALDNVFNRTQVDASNIFNQQQRTRAVDTALPGVRDQLTRQGTRAETYAEGRLPSSIDDRAFEVASRSRAADIASAGGFGGQSPAAQKASQLMSAEDRLRVSQYGDNLLTGNINTKANLLMAPTEYVRTEYADAGSQIRVMPTVDAGTRAVGAYGEINQNTLLSPGQALESEINQQQFRTNLGQRTREFNATGRFNESQFNANAANEFAMTKFNYQVGYAGAVAGAAQTSSNTQVAIDQQNAARETFDDNKDATQDANNVGAGVGIGTTIIGILDSIFGFSDLFSGDSGGDSYEDFNVSGEAAGSGINATGEADIGAAGDIASPGMSASDIDASVRSYAQQAGLTPRETKRLSRTLQSMAGVSPTAKAPKVGKKQAKQAVKTSTATLRSAGLSYSPQRGYVQAGYDGDGQPVYVDRALANNQSVEPGRKDVRTTASILKPFKNFTRADQRNMERLYELTSPQFILTLDSIAAAKNPEKFMQWVNKAIRTLTSSRV